MGKKAAAKEEAEKQSDTNIENGYQTEEQKSLVLALIDAVVGSEISGTISGHNDPKGQTSNIYASVTGATPKEDKGDV
jgi:hypothetical protein